VKEKTNLFGGGKPAVIFSEVGVDLKIFRFLALAGNGQEA